MAIICSLCGKKQSGWIEDYSLAPHLQEYRICASCHTKLSMLSQNTPESSEEKSFFLDLLKQNDYPEEISSLLNELIKSDSVITAEDISLRLQNERLQEIESIQLTSGFNFENHNIVFYHGFISAETALGMGFFKSIAASITNVVGTESESLKANLKAAKDSVIYELKKQAYEKNANAIIGMSIDYTMFADSIVGVIVSGTAVTIE